MNLLFAYGAKNEVLPALMFAVYLALDAGECFPDHIQVPSPADRFTRPEIARILANDAAA